MPKISIASLAKIDVAQPVLHGVRIDGEFTVRPMMARETEQLHLYHCVIEPGTALHWEAPTADSCAYVRAGTIKVNGVEVDAGGCFIIEHGSHAETVSAGGAEFALFQDRRPSGKPGGHVHLIRADQVPQNHGTDHGDLASSELYADATCATCDIWLHGNHFPEGMEVGLHRHSEDEIILVNEGSIVLGPRSFGADTAVAVAAQTLYTFKAGAGGMNMVNFRVGSPCAMHPGSDRVIDEGAFFRGRLGSPEHVTVLPPSS